MNICRVSERVKKWILLPLRNIIKEFISRQVINIKNAWAVDRYNSENFLHDAEYRETIDDEPDDIKKFVNEKKDMDKIEFVEIVNRIFCMFNDESVDTEELWNLLLKMTVGPAKGIAKETLKELISKSDDQLDIVRYHHLLYEIEEGEYLLGYAD